MKLHHDLLRSALGALLLGIFANAAPASSAETNSVAKATAVVVIDVQNFYFPGGKLPLVEPAAASAQARKLLDHFRARGWPVIHVQHLPKDQNTPTPDTGDEQYRIHASVKPLAGETVIGKHYANAFRETKLRETLETLHVQRVLICGMQTHMCVEAATRAAADFGFEVLVAHDACATRNLKFKDTEVPAAQVHASALAAMNGSYARILSTDELLAELK